MCTDNMPSGSAMKLGDVLTIRNGKTVEIHNTDAEGRLILADGLVAGRRGEARRNRRHRHAHRRLPGARSGTRWPACSATTNRSSTRCKAAPVDVDEPVWQLPLEQGTAS